MSVRPTASRAKTHPIGMPWTAYWRKLDRLLTSWLPGPSVRVLGGQLPGLVHDAVERLPGLEKSVAYLLSLIVDRNWQKVPVGPVCSIVQFTAGSRPLAL